MEKRFVSAEELAVYLGVKIDTVRTWAWQGKLLSHKFGRLVRFDLKEIEETWIKDTKVIPHAQ